MPKKAAYSLVEEINTEEEWLSLTTKEVRVVLFCMHIISKKKFCTKPNFILGQKLVKTTHGALKIRIKSAIWACYYRTLITTFLKGYKQRWFLALFAIRSILANISEILLNQ